MYKISVTKDGGAEFLLENAYHAAREKYYERTVLTRANGNDKMS